MFTLGMIELSGPGAANVGLAAIAAFAVAKWLFNKDEAIEDRRSDAIDAVAVLHEWGLAPVASIVKRYAVGDYSKALHELRELAKTLIDPVKAAAAFEKLFVKILESKLKDRELRGALVEKVNKMAEMFEAKATTPAAPAA